LLAAHKNQKNVFDALIEKGAQINVETADETHLLHLLAENRTVLDPQCKIIDQLLKINPNLINLQNKEGLTPFHKIILSNDANLFSKISFYRPNLHKNMIAIAAAHNNYTIVEKLIEMGCQSGENFKNKNEIFHAIDHKNEKMIQLLSKKFPHLLTEKDAHVNSSLHAAVENKLSKESCELVLTQARSLINVQNNDGYTALALAAQKSPEFVSLLLKYDADQTIKTGDGKTALILSVLHKNYDAVEILAQSNTINSVDKEGNTALHHALELKDETIIKILLRNSNISTTIKNKKGEAQIDKSFRGSAHTFKLVLEKTAWSERKPFLNLKKGIGKGHAFVDVMLDFGAQVNISDENGIYPVHAAVEASDLESLRKFCVRGAPVDIRNANDKSAIARAAEKGDLNMVRYLTGQGANLHARFGTEHCSLMHCAAQSGNSEILTFFEQRGLSANVKDIHGNTPFMKVIASNKKEAAQWFLDRKLSIDEKNNRGQSARDLAQEWNNSHLFDGGAASYVLSIAKEREEFEHKKVEFKKLVNDVRNNIEENSN